MPKRTKLFVSLTTLVLIGGAVIYSAVIYLLPVPINLREYRSPDNSLAVNVVDNSSLMNYVLWEKSISFSVSKDGEPVARKERLLSYDGYRDFFLDFADAYWEGSNQLVFRRRAWRNDGPERDEIQVSNFSGNDIRFLRIYDFDIYLVFGLRKNETRSILIRKKLANGNQWLEASGSFDNGEQIKQTGKNFHYEESNVLKKTRYCLRIEQDPVWSECRSGE